HFVSADVDGPADDSGKAALVGGRGVGVVARVHGGTAGKQGHRLARPTVVLKGSEQRIDRTGRRADLVAVDSVGQAAAAGAVADQIVAGRRDGSEKICSVLGRVTGNKRVDQDDRAVGGVHAAAPSAAAV